MHGKVVMQYFNISALIELIYFDIKNPHESFSIPAVIYSLGRMNKDQLEKGFH